MRGREDGDVRCVRTHDWIAEVRAAAGETGWNQEGVANCAPCARTTVVPIQRVSVRHGRVTHPFYLGSAPRPQ